MCLVDSDFKALIVVTKKLTLDPNCLHSGAGILGCIFLIKEKTGYNRGSSNGNTQNATVPIHTYTAYTINIYFQMSIYHCFPQQGQCTLVDFFKNISHQLLIHLGAVFPGNSFDCKHAKSM